MFIVHGVTLVDQHHRYITSLSFIVDKYTGHDSVAATERDNECDDLGSQQALILLHLKLSFIETSVDPSSAHQLIMPAILHKSTVIKHYNSVNIVKCG